MPAADDADAAAQRDDRAALVVVATAWSAAALALATTLAAVILLAAGHAGEVPWKPLLSTAAWSVPGALIAAGRPRIAVGWLMLAVALLFAGSGLAQAWVTYALAEGLTSGVAWAVWFTDRFSAVLVVCALVALLLLPDGRLPAPWWRVLLGVVVPVQVLVLAVFVLAAGPAAGPGSSFPPEVLGLQSPAGVLPRRAGEAVQGFDTLVLQLPLLLVPLAVVTRLRSASAVDRRRLVDILLAVAVFALLVVLGHGLWPSAAHVLDVVGSLLVGATLTAAVLRRRLDQVEVVVHSTAVHVVLTALVGGAYVLVTSLAARSGDEAGLPPFGAGVVAGVIALSLLPLRARMHRAVERLVHGDRADPYAAVERLARRTHGAPTLDAVLTQVGESVRASLRVPLVRVSAAGAAVEVGGAAPTAPRMSSPLRSGTTTLGTVEVRAGPGRRLTGDDQRLLDALGVHGGIAVQAVLLAGMLQASRERIVTAREEERRRVGRDLHDGLGPTLAGLTMQLGAVRRVVTSDPELAARRLEALEGAAREGLSDVRRVARGLRSPALEQLGLVEALRQSGRALGLDVTVTARPPGQLPTAVESAAYLIATEALTNVARHTGAGAAELDVRVGDGALTVSVSDRGSSHTGAPAGADHRVGARRDRVPGTGLAGMQERAAELGGSVTVGSAPGGGTTVVAHLPLRDGVAPPGTLADTRLGATDAVAAPAPSGAS